jgi:hypothetical protein
MAATWTINLTLSPDSSGYIDCCNHVGAYIIIVRCETPEGSHAIFNIASASDGQKRVKRTVGVAGDEGEQLLIVWPEDSCPILCYETDELAPKESRHYNVKVI